MQSDNRGLQSDRSIQDIMEALALSDDESQLSFSAKEMRTALNLYMSYRKQADEWKRLATETKQPIPTVTIHSNANGLSPKRAQWIGKDELYMDLVVPRPKYPDCQVDHKLMSDAQRGRIQGWNACIEMMKELNA